MNPMLLKFLLGKAGGGGGAGRGLISAAGNQGGATPSAPFSGAQQQQPPLMAYLQSQGSKIYGGNDPSTGIDWQTGRQKYGPEGPGPGATNQLDGLQALGK